MEHTLTRQLLTYPTGRSLVPGPGRAWSAVSLLILLSFGMFCGRLEAQFPAGLLSVQQKLTDIPALGFSGGRPTVIRGDRMLVATNIYERSGTNWSLVDQLQVSDAAVPGFYVLNVAMSEPGDRIVLGAPELDGDRGAAYIFEHDGSAWTERQKLTAPSRRAGAYFGGELVLQGNTLVVGAPDGLDLFNNSTGPGSAYIYGFDGSAWTLVKQIVAGDAATGAFFGQNLALRDGILLAGALGDNNANGTHAGAAYFFARDEGGAAAWGQVDKVLATNGGLYEDFGKCLALGVDSAVIGSIGGLYEFRPNPDGSWAQRGDRFAPPDTSYPQPYLDAHAMAMNVSGDLLVVTDFQEEGQTGAAYVYERQGGDWVYRRRLVSPDVPSRQFFLGWTLSLSERSIIIGTTVRALYVFHPDYLAVGKYLYHSEADNSFEFPKNQAAFRYKDLLFAPDPGDPAQRIRAQFETFSTFYDESERARAQRAGDLLREGLEQSPESVGLRDLLLDLYYDRTVAEAVIAKNRLKDAENARLGPPSTAGGFVVDDEIGSLNQALATNEVALTGYFRLLKDDLGLPDRDPPLGYEIFEQRVPFRGLDPATYLEGEQSVSVTGSSEPLYSGYRDLVLLFDLLRDRGQIAARLVRLHLAQGNDAAANATIGDSVRSLQIHRDLLLAVFPGLDLPSGDSSGLPEAMGGVDHAIGELNELAEDLLGNQNPLGFEDDLLLFVQRFQGQNPELFDSFNSLKEWLQPTTNSTPLGIAIADYGEAVSAYSTFRGNQDEIREQFEGSTVTFDFRLFEIVGARPGEPGYDAPGNNQGSEIWQQWESINVARLRVRQNRTNILNLREQIQIEITRSDQLQDAHVKYGNRQAKLTEWMGHISAVQASSDALVEGFSIDKLTPWGVFAVGENAVIQGAGEELKGQIAAEKERLAAFEQADIVGIESRAVVKNLMLEMNTLALESEETAMLLRQEMGRLAALHREKADLERRIAERNADLASRYYADPVHHLSFLHEQVLANNSFRNAQRWLFFMVRAFEYKWNTSFAITRAEDSPDGHLWQKDDLFRCRNADELRRFYNAMVNFDGTFDAPSSDDDRFDWFSIREHAFGYRRFDNQGQPLFYVDPETGQTVDAIEAFRRRLARSKDVDGVIRLRFSTVRQLPNSSFFKGPDLTGIGLYLDKIRWLKIRLPGTHSTTNFPNSNPAIGSMTYGGTSFVRNQSPGFTDPEHPDRLTQEMTAYSTRYWYKKAPTTVPPDPGGWRSQEAFTADGLPMLKVSNLEQRRDGAPGNPDVLPSVDQVDVFKERSVAASGWQINLPTEVSSGGDVFTVLRVEELDDIEIYFYHYALNRVP